MKVLRDNLFPVAFLAVWLAVSGYTLHALRGLRALRAVEGTVTLTITPPPPSHHAAASSDEGQ